MEDWIYENVVLTALLAVGLVISLRLLFGLWLLPGHRQIRLRAKVIWSAVVMVPFFGGLVYGALFRLPGREFGAMENSNVIGDSD